MENTLSDIFTVQNAVLLASLFIAYKIAAVILKSKTVQELISGMKELGTVQKELLEGKEQEIKDLQKEIEILKTELTEEKKQNKRLRDYDFENRGELAQFRRDVDKHGAGGETKD